MYCIYTVLRTYIVWMGEYYQVRISCKFYCFPLIIQYSFRMKAQEKKQKSATPRFADPSRGESGKNPIEQTPLNPPLSGGHSKIAILHDAFLYRGGGERLVTLMAKSLDADLITGFFSEGSFDPRELGFEGRMIALGAPIFAKGFRHMFLKWRFFWKARILREYDTVIFSGDCLGALEHVRKDAEKIYYCHTPPRYLYDMRERYLRGLPFLARPIFHGAFLLFAFLYERNLQKFDHIITNSKNVQKRLKDFTGYDSEIVYPPTDVRRFSPNVSIPLTRGTQGVCWDTTETNPPTPLIRGASWTTFLPTAYFLSFARLSPPKRVDLIVDAFLQMPEENLIFCYGKNDPMKEVILKKIEWKKNIIALESPNDTELISLIQNATATIYIPVDEDFGMSPVESMACGTPVIGVDEWGLRETVIDGKTGKLIEIMDYELWMMNLKQVIQETQKEEWGIMKDYCIARAKDFSLDTFEIKLRKLLI